MKGGPHPEGAEDTDIPPTHKRVEVRDWLLRQWFETDARFVPCDPPSKAKQEKQKRAASERAASTTTAKEK